MGSGASRRNAAQEKKRKAAKGGGDSRSADEDRTDPSLQRRRRVLFGDVRPCSFEQIKPQDQFTAQPEDPNFSQEGFHSTRNLVYERCELHVFNEFRNRAQDVRFSKQHDQGFLDKNAIELLELGLDSNNWLSTRFFEVAQAQEVESQRPEKLTCYELLALFSVVRYGQQKELLELLFCVSDVDGDDRVSQKDLELFILAFLKLELGDATADSDEDETQDFQKMNDKLIKKEASALATKAIKQYSQARDDEDSDAGPAGRGRSDTDSQGSGSSDASTKALAGQRKKSKQAKGPAGQKGKKSKAGCFGGGGKKKGPPALNYEQWLKWLGESNLLPEEWRAVLQEACTDASAPTKPRAVQATEVPEEPEVSRTVEARPFGEHTPRSDDDSVPSRRLVVGSRTPPTETETEPFIPR